VRQRGVTSDACLVFVTPCGQVLEPLSRDPAVDKLFLSAEDKHHSSEYREHSTMETRVQEMRGCQMTE
jgi:hypothetical protein